MASTINLQGTINWCGPHLKYQPLMIGGSEPAVTYGNLVMQTMLGPPFKWPWNRGTAGFNAIPSPVTQDYALVLNDFGFLEAAAVTDPVTGKPMEISIANSLQRDGSQSRPTHVAAQLDDGAGHITFRLLPSPDKAYRASVDYQRKVRFMTSLASTWYPIPDEMSYVFNWGFLTLGSILTNDARFSAFNAKFVTHLLSAQGGLDEMARNIFLGNWLQVTAMAQGSQLNVTQRSQARQT